LTPKKESSKDEKGEAAQKPRPIERGGEGGSGIKLGGGGPRLRPWETIKTTKKKGHREGPSTRGLEHKKKPQRGVCLQKIKRTTKTGKTDSSSRE